jgi:dienelactone hydrolase
MSHSHLRPSASICGLLLVAAPALAWPGHNWADWKKVTTWTKPDLKTPQAGRQDLAPLLVKEGQAIDEIRAWEQRRAEIATTISRVFGQPAWATSQPTSSAAPGATSRPAIEAEILGEEILPDHIRRHVRIRTETDDWIPAYVLLPKNPPAGRLPAMICLHQTSAQGKDEPAGIKGDTDLALGPQLVRRGYVCICPDAIGFGERIRPGGQPYDGTLAFYRRHPNWSLAGKMIWDVSRVVDYLETLPCVDPLQIGCIGHSHGGYGTLFAAAFEPRISLAVVSCGFNTFRADPTPNRWSHLTALVPQIGDYLPEKADIPFDWQELIALVAPRPLFVWYALHDDCFPQTDGLDAMFKDIRGVYGLYGAADDLAWVPFDGPHKFPPDGREQAYKWIGERFSPAGGLRAESASLVAWNAERERIQARIGRTLGLHGREWHGPIAGRGGRPRARRPARPPTRPYRRMCM